MGRPFRPLEIAHSRGGIWTTIQYMVPWAQPSPQPKWHLNRFSRFAGLTTVTDQQTDHTTRLVTIGRIYVCSTAMWPKIVYIVKCHIQRYHILYYNTECRIRQLKIVCTSLQTDNHASTSSLNFFYSRMLFLTPSQQCQNNERISL